MAHPGLFLHFCVTTKNQRKTSWPPLPGWDVWKDLVGTDPMRRRPPARWDQGLWGRLLRAEESRVGPGGEMGLMVEGGARQFPSFQLLEQLTLLSTAQPFKENWRARASSIFSIHLGHAMAGKDHTCLQEAPFASGSATAQLAQWSLAVNCCRGAGSSGQATGSSWWEGLLISLDFDKARNK